MHKIKKYDIGPRFENVDSEETQQLENTIDDERHLKIYLWKMHWQIRI